MGCRTSVRRLHEERTEVLDYVGRWRIRGRAAGGAGDGFEAGEEGLEQGSLADRGAELADAGAEEFFQNGIEDGEEQGGFAAEGEIGGIDDAEGLDSGGAVGMG